jgi:two-component system, response regulator PdtaR
MEISQYTVLLVEDDPLLRMISHDGLSAAGYHVIEAANASEAVAILEARGDISCVVSDIVMPGDMNGIALSWEMQSRWPLIPMILSSGKALPSPANVPDSTIMLQKPFALGDLRTAVSRAIIGSGPEDATSRNDTDAATVSSKVARARVQIRGPQ